MNNVTYQIATLLITLIGVILTRLVVPWIKLKIDAEKLKDIKHWVSVAVAAAEQMKFAGLLQPDETKKMHVLKFIRDRGITITDQELEELIEAAVHEMNKAKYLLFKNLDTYDLKEHEE